MLLNDAITLISTDEFDNTPQVWADLGCGSGLFTKALAAVLPPASVIYAVDRIAVSIRPADTAQAEIIQKQFDFVRDVLELPKLDGILMANALHFVKNKQRLVEKLKGHFKAGPRFIFVEYDTNFPNPWVPYPIGFASLQKTFAAWGFSRIKKISERPSVYHSNNIYSVIVRE